MADTDKHFAEAAISSMRWALRPQNIRRTDFDVQKYIADAQSAAIAFASR